MNDQGTLDLFRSIKTDINADLERLVAYLRGRGWRTAREIAAVIGFNDRYTRRVAEFSEGAIIGSDLGYKLTGDATPEEINEWEGRYASQIERMTARRVKTLKAWHSRRAA
jgi:hypothetical protein